tara:strand:+ start:328 stop:468 length:141 start_codon:yes stop_codon:yes gene_type:complete
MKKIFSRIFRRGKFCPKNFLNVDKKLNSNPLNINHKKKGGKYEKNR